LAEDNNVTASESALLLVHNSVSLMQHLSLEQKVCNLLKTG